MASFVHSPSGDREQSPDQPPGAASAQSLVPRRVGLWRSGIQELCRWRARRFGPTTPGSSRTGSHLSRSADQQSVLF